MTIKEFNIRNAIPTKGYLCRASLDFFDQKGFPKNEFPHVWKIGDKYVLADGHNKMHYFFSLGLDKIPVNLHDFEDYRHNAEAIWAIEKIRKLAKQCEEKGIKSILDLQERILPTRKDVENTPI